MSYTFRPSLEEQFTKAPTIALAGPTGSGKTESAMRLARGYCGDGVRFAVIDTEEKRALYKRNRHQPWDWLDFQPPFTPERYIDVLEAAKNYPAVVLDSGSHEWSGEGGCQDMQAEALERMAKGDAGKLAALNGPAWRAPKLEHKKMMHRLIRYPTLLIVCLRAEPKVKFTKDERGKTQIVDAGFQPICEKMFMYEMLVGAMMHSDAAGVPVHIKQLEPELEPVFIAGRQIDEGTGARLRAWADGRAAAPRAPSGAEGSDTLKKIAAALEFANDTTKKKFTAMVATYDVQSVDQLNDDAQRQALKWLNAQIDKQPVTT